MAKKTKYRIGIDIGSNAIKLASYHINSNKVKLNRLVKHDFLQENVVEHVHDINETHILAGLTDLFKAFPYRRASIRVACSPGYNNIFSLQIPQVAKSELKQALYWKIGPLVSEPIENYDFDYTILPQTERKKISVLLAVVRKRKVESLNKIFKSFSTNIDLLETSFLPAVDLLQQSLPPKAPVYGLLYLGGLHSHYAIVDSKHYPEFLYIPFGGSKMNEMISKAENIPFRDVEFMRCGKMDHPDDSADIISLSMQNEALSRLLQNLSLTIKKMNYRHLYKTGEAIEKIYVSGGLVNDKFIEKFIRRGNDFFGTPTEIWDPIDTYYPHYEQDEQANFQYATAIGLALR